MDVPTVVSGVTELVRRDAGRVAEQRHASQVRFFALLGPFQYSSSSGEPRYGAVVVSQMVRFKANPLGQEAEVPSLPCRRRALEPRRNPRRGALVYAASRADETEPGSRMPINPAVVRHEWRVR